MEITEEVNITNKEIILEVTTTLRVRTHIARKQMLKIIFLLLTLPYHHAVPGWLLARTFFPEPMQAVLQSNCLSAYFNVLNMKD